MRDQGCLLQEALLWVTNGGGEEGVIVQITAALTRDILQTKNRTTYNVTNVT